MRLHPKVVFAFAIGAVAGTIGGCQVYDFQPVVPLTFTQVEVREERFGRALKPNIMLVVDKSGSMDLPVDRNDPDCRFTDGGSCGVSKNFLCNPSVCPTRWSELQGAMGDFLGSRGDVGRLGLSVYPTNGVCGILDGGNQAAVVVEVDNSDDDNASLIATANEINVAIQSIASALPAGTPTTTGGGTPTGESIKKIASLPSLNDPEREDLILLLTDGLPNCNSSHPFAPPAAECRCVENCGAPDPRSCTDLDATVAAIAGVRVPGNRLEDLRTVVVGFGADLTTGIAGEVLNAMATAGGFPRACNTDGGSPACPAGETCQADGTCPVTKYYQAANRSDLAAALEAIVVGIPDPCEFPISQNPEGDDERLVVVYITESGGDPQRLVAGPDTFSYSPGLVTLTGSTCSLVSNATAADPVIVRIAVLASLE